MSLESTAPQEPQAGIVESAEEVRKMLRQALLLAAEQGGRELCWLDADFATWPLSDPALLEALSRWALPHRRLHLLATDYEPLRRVHPRFVQWRQFHDHVITAGAYDPADALERSQPSPQGVVLAPGLLVMKLWTPVRASLSLRDAREEAMAREWFDAIEQRSATSFASSTLGL
ncbi:hypothetical protein CDN99_00225 [Roseateles aquatilis]|uniref:Uncharacterized protein n=1 Tax=Roseateles aquatilis TaxID=431061 RepID=A0A246JK64_9BURK|nr:hypothetical protein [Roseateles aquatilis]OWQ92975.1 hypothetical protein CDN99_00225 [Roseateles aquatilis]